MRKYKILISLLMVVLLISGCQNENKKNEKFTIVTTLFPQYDFLSQIVLDKAEVVLLMPPGADAHTFEPTPQNIKQLSESDLFVYTSDNMEVYAKGILDSVNSSNLAVVNIGEYLDLNDLDPHFWLDFAIAYEIVEYLVEVVSDLDPNNREFYKSNGEKILKDINGLDNAYWEVVNNKNNDTLVFAGHFAFDYFVNRYDLKHISPYKNASENAEASIKNIKEIINFIRENDTKSIYFEELSDPKLAKMISDEVDVNIFELSAAHNVSKEQFESKITFIDIMYENLENLKIGLEYEK